MFEKNDFVKFHKCLSARKDEMNKKNKTEISNKKALPFYHDD
jgi:hypothetical protein